eukprot:360757_1
MQDFAFVVADIACYASNCSSVYHTLNSITKKLMTCDIRYRTLDTSRAKVMERLIGFEGVLEFLMLLGFESDVLGMKLQCKEQPRADFVMPIRDLLQRYMQMYEDPNCNTVDEMISSTYDNAQSSEILKRLVLTHKMFTNSVTFLAIISSKITVQTVQILKNWMNSYWRLMYIRAANKMDYNINKMIFILQTIMTYGAVFLLLIFRTKLL